MAPEIKNNTEISLACDISASWYELNKIPFWASL
jgi:hypothetical protein